MRRRASSSLGSPQRLSVLPVLTAALLALTAALPLGHGGTATMAAQQSPRFQTDEAGVIDETSYESPQYGYTVTWESPWEVDDASTSRRRGDVLTLAADDATLRFTGQAAEGEPADLLETTIGTLLEDQPQVDLVADDPDADAPSAVLEGNTNQILLEVHAVADGDAFVLVELQAPIDAVEDAVASAEAVLLDDEAILAPAGESGETSTETETEDGSPLAIADPTEEAST